MSFLGKLRDSSKDVFLGGLRGQVVQQAVSEIASGKMVSPVDLDEMCSRILPAFRKNPITSSVLKTFKVTDEELRELLRAALAEAGVEVK